MRIYAFIGLIAFIFAAGACGEDSAPLSLLGESCETDTSCESELCILELGTDEAVAPITFIGGYCSVSGCNFIGTSGEDDCEEGICLQYDVSMWDEIEPIRICFAEGCTTDMDCRDSYVCLQFEGTSGPRTACIPVDATDGDATKEDDTADHKNTSPMPLISDRRRS